MNRLKELRKKQKNTQQDIADILKMSRRGYQKIENGESQIKPDKAQELADFFGVSVGYLLGYEENSNSLLDEIASNLNKQLTIDEQEHLKKHPELNEYYLGMAWDRMLQNTNTNISNVHHKISNNFSSTHYELNNNFSSIHYESNNNFSNIHHEPVVKIKKLENSLSDEEIKALPKDEQKEYIQNSVGEIRKEIRDLNKKMDEFKLAYKKIISDLNIEQMNELTSNLIKMLADIEQMKTSTNSRPTQEKDNL